MSLSIFLIAWAIYGGDLIGGGFGFGWSQTALLASGLLLALSCLLSAKWTGGLLAMYLSVGATLFVAEIALRPILGPRYFGVFELDPDALYKLAPNTSRAYNRQSIMEEGYITYQINSHGFRGEELRRSEEGKRVVVYGDSFIHAEFSSLNDSFTEQLEQQLSKKNDRQIEVVNAGVAGYGPDQIVRRMEKELEWLQPDLVIAGIFVGNDFGDLVRNKLYRLNENDDLRINEYVVSDDILRKMALSRGELLLKKILRSVIRNLKPVDEAPERDNQWKLASIERGLEQNTREFKEFIGGDNEVVELASDPYNGDVSMTPDSPSAVYKRKLMARVTEKMKSVAADNDVPLLLMIIPHPMDVLGGKHDSGSVDQQKYPQYNPETLTDTMQAIADKYDINAVNLFDVFRQQDANRLYFRGGDDHWNEQGQRLAAEFVAQYVITHALLN